MDNIKKTEGAASAKKYQKLLLEFLDELLYSAFRQKKGADYENLSMRGLVITEKEVEQAFGQLRTKSMLPEGERAGLAELAEIIRREEERAGDTLPFFSLCEEFLLTSLERLGLLLALAPLLNRKYEKIYGYLQDDIGQRMPTRGLCISLAELLGTIDPEEYSAFLNDEGNLKYLIENEKNVRGLAQGYQLCERTMRYLHGSGEPAEILKERFEYFFWGEDTGELLIRRESLDRLCLLWDGIMGEEETEQDGMGSMVFLYGKQGIGKKFLLKALAKEKMQSLVFLDISKLMYESEETIWKVLDAFFAECIFRQACPCLTNGDIYVEKEEGAEEFRRDRRRDILRYMGEHSPLFFLASENKEEQMTDYPGKKVCMEIPALSACEKICLWKKFGRNFRLEGDVDPEQNGNKYILTPKGILDTLSTAEYLAAQDGETGISQRHIREAVGQNQKNQLGAYATLINSRFVWDDLILGDEQKRQMRMVCNQMKYRDVVGETWGFHRKTPYGRGLSVLFYGPPGTGKTMAAQVMANELGLDLYRIDISQMVSKYIGETQKNISELFRKARDINALLFFDEADSLFAKRSEAKDSHDRNANAETAHLLQKLEDYEGITVLATNYLNNIDDAFKRRIKFIINIAFPTAEVRLRLWRSTIPPEAERAEELDLEFFAEHFELSGSSIKEILTNAAYLAASEHRGLANQDLVEAVKLNYAKYGKILSREDFGYLG